MSGLWRLAPCAPRQAKEEATPCRAPRSCAWEHSFQRRAVNNSFGRGITNLSTSPFQLRIILAIRPATPGSLATEVADSVSSPHHHPLSDDVHGPRGKKGGFVPRHLPMYEWTVKTTAPVRGSRLSVCLSCRNWTWCASVACSILAPSVGILVDWSNRSSGPLVRSAQASSGEQMNV
jgi:hypothetical protein